MRSIKLLVMTGALAVLAACGGDGDEGGATVTGGVVKGPVLGSTVCAYAISGGAKGAKHNLTLGTGAAGSISGGCYVTAADGGYNFKLPSGVSGDVLIEATGGTFCTNETPIAAGACPGGGTIVNLGAATMTSAVAVPANGSAAVFTTPLTTAAVTNAGAGLSAATFNARFNTLAGQVIGAGTTVTPATQPTSGNQPYLGTAATAIQNGGTLSTVVTALASGTTTFPGGSAGGGGSGTTPGTVNAALVTTYNLQFFASPDSVCPTAGCPFTDGQLVSLSITADGTLSLPGKQLTNAFYRNFNGVPHLPEIIWLDSATNIEYALTDNEGGHFNEINVGNAANPQGPSGVPGFLGQLRAPMTGVQQTLAAIAGTYNKAQQYAGAEASWTSVTIAADGKVSFTGGSGGPSVTNVATVTAFGNVGGQTIGIDSATDLNGHGVDSSDRILFYLDSANHVKDIEYYGSDFRVTGVTLRKTGEANPVAIGAPGTGTWAITPGKITGTVGTTDYPLDVTIFNGTSSGFIELRAISGNLDWKIRLDDVVTTASAANNTNYSCVHGARDQRAIELKVSVSSTLSSRKGGNCNIVVTSITFNGTNANQIDAISGRFTAELYADGRTQSLVVSNGAFNWTRPLP